MSDAAKSAAQIPVVPARPNLAGAARAGLRALIAVAVIASATAAAAAGPAVGDLTVHAAGFKDTQGHAVAKLFLPGENVRGKGHWEAMAPIYERASDLRFGDLPAGRYAVVVFHDQNGNGRIDHGAFRPSELLGFSGGFVLSLTSGLPTFEKLEFKLAGPSQTLPVTVR